MKKILLASTMLIGAAGMAAADVSISGYGRFGLYYDSNTAAAFNKTVFESRLRMTISGTMETDGGVTFGGKFRAQYNQGDPGAAFNAAQYWIAYEGLTVQFGNVDTAFDSVALNYNSEMGFVDSSVGDTQDWGFFAYNSQPFAVGPGYTGVAAFYSISDVNLYLSYVNPDQYAKNLPVGEESELGIAADYTFNQFTVAAAYTSNAAGIKNHNIAFLGAAYNFGDGNVGLNYYNFDDPLPGAKSVDQVTLYGNYTFGATTLRAVITDLDTTGSKTGYGIGADYDLGNGARVSGSYQRDVDGDKMADLGVRFDF